MIPKLALGTWLMGGTKDPDPNNDDQKDISVIQTAIDNGITLIDTAQNYAAGKCEELVGQAITKYARDGYQILTKQTRDELSYDGVINGCKASLKRLGIDYIDYFVCHAPSKDADMSDFFKASNKLFKDGLIRNVGVSNFGPKTLQIALDTSELPISLNQVSFSLLDDDILTTGTYDFCIKNDIQIQAFRTLVGIENDYESYKILKEISIRYECSPQQIVLSYLNSYDNMNFTVRASSAEHWNQIKAAMDIKLDSKDIEQLKHTQNNKKGGFREFLLV